MQTETKLDLKDAEWGAGLFFEKILEAHAKHMTETELVNLYFTYNQFIDGLYKTFEKPKVAKWDIVPLDVLGLTEVLTLLQDCPQQKDHIKLVGGTDLE